jgi:hypothetical protein
MGGGSTGGSLACSSNYCDDAETWMWYGPFSLADASAAELRLKAWLKTESTYDHLFIAASVDGNNFTGTAWTGDSAGWFDEVLDLSDVGSLGSLLGQNSVWVALMFDSDGSVNYPVGAYVDSIVLRKCVGGGCAGSGSAVPAGTEAVQEFRTVQLPTGGE